VLFFLLNYRMENQKLTYFTSNLTWIELEKHYLQINEKDPNNKIKVNRLLERIKTLATQFSLKGEDHRY
jgi:primosomal protein DnaI